MARKSIKKEQNFQQRLQSIVEKEAEFYRKEGIARRFVITFPNRHKAPLLGRIGVKLLGLSRGVIQIQYDEVK